MRDFNVGEDVTSAEYTWVSELKVRLAVGRENPQLEIILVDDRRVVSDTIRLHHKVHSGLASICEWLGLGTADLPATNLIRKLRKADIPEELIDEVRTFDAEDCALLDRIDAINARGSERLKVMSPV